MSVLSLSLIDIMKGLHDYDKERAYKVLDVLRQIDTLDYKELEFISKIIQKEIDKT